MEAEKTFIRGLCNGGTLTECTRSFFSPSSPTSNSVSLLFNTSNEENVWKRLRIDSLLLMQEGKKDYSLRVPFPSLQRG